MISRGRMLLLAAAAPLAVRCTPPSGSVRVGSKNFAESFVIAEIYSQALERQNFHVDRLFNLGSTEIALAAMQRGDIDLYPEYTGTALIDVLHLPPMSDPQTIYTTVSRDFKQRFDLVWLQPSPMNDSQGLATTRAIATARHLVTLSDVSRAAPNLRLATIPEFLSRPDGLPGLQKVYGGFQFESIRSYDIALKYQALLEGRADIATAFTTDGEIATDALVVMIDNKHFWPPYNVAPVVRAATLQRQPQIARILNAIAPAITDSRMRAMNAAVESEQDPADVASAFLAEAEPRQ